MSADKDTKKAKPAKSAKPAKETKAVPVKKAAKEPTEEGAKSIKERIMDWAKTVNKTRKNPFVRAAARVIARAVGLPAGVGSLAGGATGSGLAGLGYYAYNKISKEAKIHKYNSAIKRGDSAEVARLSREYSSSVKKAAAERRRPNS